MKIKRVSHYLIGRSEEDGEKKKCARLTYESTFAWEDDFIPFYHLWTGKVSQTIRGDEAYENTSFVCFNPDEFILTREATDVKSYQLHVLKNVSKARIIFFKILSNLCIACGKFEYSVSETSKCYVFCTILASFSQSWALNHTDLTDVWLREWESRRMKGIRGSVDNEWRIVKVH